MFWDCRFLSLFFNLYATPILRQFIFLIYNHKHKYHKYFYTLIFSVIVVFDIFNRYNNPSSVKSKNIENRSKINIKLKNSGNYLIICSFTRFPKSYLSK